MAAISPTVRCGRRTTNTCIGSEDVYCTALESLGLERHFSDVFYSRLSELGGVSLFPGLQVSKALGISVGFVLRSKWETAMHLRDWELETPVDCESLNSNSKNENSSPKLAMVLVPMETRNIASGHRWMGSVVSRYPMNSPCR